MRVKSIAWKSGHNCKEAEINGVRVRLYPERRRKYLYYSIYLNNDLVGTVCGIDKAKKYAIEKVSNY